MGVQHRADGRRHTAVARYIHARAACDRYLRRARAKRDVVHDDEMLAKCLDIDLGPVGRRIGLELSDDRRNGRVRILACGRRGRAGGHRTVSGVVHTTLSQSGERGDGERQDGDASHGVVSSVA